VHAVSVCVDFRHEETYFNLHWAGIKNLHLTHYVAVGQIVTWGVCFELVIASNFKKYYVLCTVPHKILQYRVFERK